MPIKIPKGFTRRKSSGNVLEEVENHPQSSFRVIERPSTDRRSASEGNLLSPKNGKAAARRSSQHLESPDNFFLGSQKSLSKNRYGFFNLPTNIRGKKRLTRFSISAGTDSSANESYSFQRLSSSSAGHRSSNEAPAPENTLQWQPRTLHDIPPLTGALRAAGRTLSFGGRFYKPSSTPQPAGPPSGNKTATATTAAPPKLLDTDLNIGTGSDFKSMLDNFGSPDREVQEPSAVDKSTRPVWISTSLNYRFKKRYANRIQASPMALRTIEKQPRPPPINIDRSKEVEPSPYSWDSRHSEEGLLSPEQDASERRKSVSPTTSHRALERPRTNTDNRLRRSIAYSGKRASTFAEDEDARLVMASLYTNNGGSQSPFTADNEAEEDSLLFGHENAREPTPLQARRSPRHAEFEPDPSIADSARIAAQYECSLSKSASPRNKVMTPSQFEHYRRHQELRRSNSDATKSEYSEESDFDEEDEAEKNREAERQRRKQEAQLSVYRQQMMKITGQQSSATSLRPELDHASSSTPNLTVRSSNLGDQSRSGSGKSNDGDEDEEVPLGILAAHGFPSKNRPPAHLGSSRSIPNLRDSFQAPRLSSGSVHGDHDAVHRGSLPAFAKDLPRDPYYGASLVNPTNRESLALGGGSASVHGNPPSSTLPPGGLVGVIATEERARAIRRGSPNTKAMHDYAGGMMMPGGPPHPGSGIPRPYTMMSANANPSSAPSPQPQVSATEQAQIQLSQQMSQMMQMQMQWMQQIMQMQGTQSSLQPPPQMPMGTPVSMSGNPNAKPASMSAAGVLNPTTARPQGDQRALSMLDPNMTSRLNGPSMPYAAAGGNRPGTPSRQGYAPSIVPSERSNASAVPRYRPMSTMPSEHGPSPLSKPWNDENQRSNTLLAKPSTVMVNVRPASSGLISATKPQRTAAADDEDDDEGWAEMMKKRENKKSNWKTKRETSDLGDLLNAVH